MADVEDRRQFTRIPIEGKVVIDRDGQRRELALYDLSLKGALTSCPAEADELVPSADCELTVLLEGADRPIQMEVTIAHRENGRLGLQCRRIDMDSIAQLRRLVELNLGDPALLERELSALGG